MLDATLPVLFRSVSMKPKSKRLAVDVISDLSCPWCFIGAERLERVRARLEPELELDIALRPFLLQPDAPDEGTDLRAMLAKKYRRDPATLFAGVEREARSSGIPLDFEKVRVAPSTVRAHTLLRHAIGRGTQWSLGRALFRAYFLEGRDPGDLAVLRDLALRHGFTEDDATSVLGDPRELQETRREAAEATAAGVTGVPFFVLGERLALAGAQPEGTLEQALKRVALGSDGGVSS